MINGKKIVALCTYRIYEAQEFAFLSELSRIMPENDCFMFIYAMNSELGYDGNDMAEVEVFNLIPYDKVDVVVIMDEKIKNREVAQEIIDKSAAFNVPVIIVDGEYDNASMVKYDYASGFEKVVRHVIEEHKVKKPHFMGGKRNNVFSDERLAVFKKVLEENGLPFDDSMVSYGDFWALPCRAATAELLERDELPDAVICANDIMAINVCDVFQNAGIKVPQDVLVSGFDGIDEAFTASPGITTAKCGSDDLARAVMDAIVEVVAGNHKVKKWITPGFIANESCGCPKKEPNVVTTVAELNNAFYHHDDEIHVMHSITARIMMGNGVGDSIRYMKRTMAQHACVVVEESCFDLENNFFYEDVERGARIVIYDSYKSNEKPYPYDPEGIIPHLEDIMKTGWPIIFNALLYMGKSPGFVCYSFPQAELIDYNQTPNLTNCFGTCIGGYVVHRYQNYLREKIRQMYQNDALTGLFNRLAFISRMDEIFADPEIPGQKITVIMLDLNGLKQINDNLGHLAGDDAIKAVATALKASCPEQANCTRIGGDEMLAVIIGECDTDKIQADIDERLQAASQDLGFAVSASIGTYSTVFDGSMDISKIIGIADERMYEMKRKTKEGRE